MRTYDGPSRSRAGDYQRAKRVLQDEGQAAILRAEGCRRMARGGKKQRLSASEERLNAEKMLALAAGISQATLYRTKKVLPHPDLDEAVVSGRLSLDAAARMARERQRLARADEARRQLQNRPPKSGNIVNTILLDDVLDGLAKVQDASVSLVVTSMPYPLSGVKYDNHCYDGDYARYLAWMKEVFSACKRTLRPGGRIAIQFDNCYVPQTERSKTDPMIADLRTEFALMMRELQMHLIGEIIWFKQNASGNRPLMGSRVKLPRLQKTWEYISVFQNGSEGLTGPKEGIDLTDEQRNKWSMSCWYIKPTVGRLFHPCPFPVAIPERLIKLYTYIGDIVLDPFCGTGTTCYAAKRNGRRWIGIDNSPLYVEMARERLREERQTTALTPV